MNRWFLVMLSAAALTMAGCNKQESATEATGTDATEEVTPAADEAAPAEDTVAPATETSYDAQAAAPAPDAAAPADPAAAPADTAAPAELAGEGTTPGGTTYVDTVVGEGPEAQVGSTVVVHYTGTLTDGTKFDSSLDRNQPFNVTIGQTQVINGWTEGLVGMKAGGKRTLTIPPDQGYGASPQGPIPPNSTLLFDIEVLEVR